MSNARRARFQREIVGAFVLLGIVIFVAAIVQAGRLREWFDPGEDLRIVLPDEGLFGLAQGAQVEILGTPAGEVVRIVIEPDQKIHAEARVRAAMKPFVRRDSTAIIRKTFGVAGEAYLEITRGFGEPLDWDYAVLNASPDRAPTDTLDELITDVRQQVFPVIAEAERATRALADLTTSLADPNGDVQMLLSDVSTLTNRMVQGQGTVGRLLTDDTTAREVENLLTGTNRSLTQIEPILEELRKTATEVTGLTSSFNAQTDQIPGMTARIQSVLASVDSILVDLRETTPELPAVTRGIGEATANVPVLLGMTQQTLAELEALLRQLRSNWLLGGGGQTPIEEGGRIPAKALNP